MKKQERDKLRELAKQWPEGYASSDVEELLDYVDRLEDAKKRMYLQKNPGALKNLHKKGKETLLKKEDYGSCQKITKEIYAQMFQLEGSGLTRKAIAEKLGVGYQTVRRWMCGYTELSRIWKKNL